MNAQAIIANLPQPRRRRSSKSVKTDIPTVGAAEAPRARGERGHQEHPLLRVRAAFYATEYAELAARLHHHAQRRPDPQGGQGGVLGDARAARPARAPGRGGAPRVWVLNGSGRTGLGDATSPTTSPTTGSTRRRPTSASRAPLAKTRIVVYNGAEAAMPETIKYLEDLFDDDGHARRRTPRSTVDIDRHAGQGRPDIEVDAVG